MKSSILVAAISGAVAGSAVSLLLAQRAQTERAEPSAGTSMTEPVAVQSAAIPEADFRALVKEQLARNADEAASAEDAPEPRRQNSDEPEPTPQEAVRAFRQQFAENLASHRQDAYDPTWSRAATVTLEADLRGLAEAGRFTLLTTDCRTSSCAATVRWKDFAAAREGSRTILHATYGLNCGKEISLPAPEDHDAPYEARVYYDCSELRAGLAQSTDS